jgi:hypothetical protein
MCRAATWAVVIVASRTLAAGCPDAPLAAARCEVAALRSAAGCAAGGPRAMVRRASSRVAHAVGAAEGAIARGREAAGARRIAGAEATVARVQARIQVFATTGRLALPCAAGIGAALAALGQTLALAARGRTTTTTTVALPTTTAVPPTILTTTSMTTTTTTPTCGNGRLDRGEQCDGTNLFGRDCLTLGFEGGVLRCRPDCLFDISGCHF